MKVLKELESHPDKDRTGADLDKLVQCLVDKHLQTSHQPSRTIHTKRTGSRNRTNTMNYLTCGLQ